MPSLTIEDIVVYDSVPTRNLFEYATEADQRMTRCFAAAGITRALLDTPLEYRNAHGEKYEASIEWAQQLIRSVIAGREVQLPTDEVSDCVFNLPDVSGEIDSISKAATEAHVPRIVAMLVEQSVGLQVPKLVIALGHGGIISSAATYEALEGEDNAFYPVRYSRHKSIDSRPVLSPREEQLLRQLARDRKVIVHDEDRSVARTTIQTATMYFEHMVEQQAFGVTPVHADKYDRLWPSVIHRDSSGIWHEDSWFYQSFELDKLRALHPTMFDKGLE